jgi:Protein of unknown function (DUF3572)
LQCAPKPVIAGLDPAIYPPSRDCFANAPRFPEIAMADKPRSMGPQNQRAAAESLAIAALAFLAAEPGRLGRFLALTGIGPESIRAAAHQPQFLLGVLDHLAGEEPLLLAFAAENSIPPSAVMEARDTIAGRRWERDTP